tara:strand:- start:389 stop:589 length:201 start_codon:yes stop_codon:yes gene_type:complete
MTKDIKQFAIDLARTQADHYRQLSKIDHNNLQGWFRDRDQEAWELRNEEQIAEAFKAIDKKWRWER